MGRRRAKQQLGSSRDASPSAPAPASGKGKGKAREEGKEAEPQGAGRSFWKILSPENSGKVLKIPSAFSEYLEDEPTRLVSLKSSTGKTWEVELTNGSEGFCFTQGWKEFVADHSLKLGNFLVFTYNGHSQFSVMVFCSSGIEIAAQVQNGAASLSPQEVNGTKVKRHRYTKKLSSADGPAPKKQNSLPRKVVEKRHQAGVGTSEPLTIPSSKDYSKSLLDNFASYRNRTEIRSKDLPRIGTFVERKFRQPSVTSQRRPVTDVDIGLALKRATAFKSKNPFAMQTMKDTHVYVQFFMDLPREFVQESLPKTSKKLTLWDPQGKPWEVSYVYCDDTGVAAFSGNWGKFAVGNNLEKFDVCIFELFKEDNIKVHIFRAVLELTPLLRNSNPMLENRFY
ncbi:hypothetical protein ACP4OV_015025 [Aristida adscensionis]